MDAETFYYWVTPISLMLGLLGASWKWIFSEALRRRTDLPALEGNLECRVYESTDGTAVAAVTAIWTNPSPRRIYLDCNASKIYIYDITSQFGLGGIDLGHKDTRYLFAHAPYQHSDFVFYEPRTTSEFVACFKLESGRTYGARAFMVMDQEKMTLSDRVWFRDAVFST